MIIFSRQNFGKKSLCNLKKNKIQTFSFRINKIRLFTNYLLKFIKNERIYY